MSKRNKAASVQRAFMVMEATSFYGGFPAYMNSIMLDMEFQMSESGLPAPYKWTFGGGDGYAVPVVLTCSIT